MGKIYVRFDSHSKYLPENKITLKSVDDTQELEVKILLLEQIKIDVSFTGGAPQQKEMLNTTIDYRYPLFPLAVSPHPVQ